MKKILLEKLEETYKNLIVDGYFASGKTTNVMFPIIDNAICNNESLFVLDSKEEYINRYYDELKKNNYNTIILNLKDIEKSEGWNPLEYPYTLYKRGQVDKALEYLEKLANIIFCDSSNTDTLNEEASSDLFVGTALALFEDVNVDEVNFNSIYNMFNYMYTKLGNSDYFTEYFKTKDVMSKSYMFASFTFLASNDTKASIVAIAKRKLRLYVSKEKLMRFLSKTTFDFEDVSKKKTAIILITRDDDRSLDLLTAMFVEQLYSLLVEKTVDSFNFILDNFDNILFYNLVNNLESCLARNMRFYLGTRSLNEIAKRYGDYIFKLCDLVSIKNDEIKLIINNVESVISKDFETITLNKKEFREEYPKLKNVKVNVFDLENYVENKRKNEVVSNIINTDFSEQIRMFNQNEEDNLPKIPIPSISSLEQLTKKVDDNLERVKTNEKLLGVENDNKIVSELQQFRID